MNYKLIAKKILNDLKKLYYKHRLVIRKKIHDYTNDNPDDQYHERLIENYKKYVKRKMNNKNIQYDIPNEYKTAILQPYDALHYDKLIEELEKHKKES